MPLQLKILSIVLALAFLFYVVFLIRRNRAEVGPIRKWIVLAVIMVVGAFASDWGGAVARFLGFSAYIYLAAFSLILIILAIMFRLQLALIKADQQIALLMQELSILKKANLEAQKKEKPRA